MGASPASTGERRGLYYGWVVVAACLIIGTLAFSSRYSFGVFFKPLATDFSLNRATTSGIISLYMFLCGVSAILGGWLLDRFGPRKSVAAMGIFTGLSLLLASQAQVLWHLYLSYSLLLAVGTGGIYTAILATASRWFIKRRGLAVAIVTSSLGLSVVISPASAYLIAAYGWRVSYLILAFTGFLIIPLSLLLRLPARETLNLHEGEALETLNTRSAATSAGSPLVQTLKTRNFWLSFFMWFFSALCIFIIVTHLVPHAIDLGITATTAAAVLSTIGGVSILGRVVTGRISDNIGRKRTAIINTVMLALSMLWLIRADDLWGLYVFAVVFGFAWGGVNASFAGLVADVFGLQRLGVVVGILDAGFDVGAALGATFAGYIFDIRGSYTLAFLGGTMAMLVVTGLVPMLRIRGRSKTG